MKKTIKVTILMVLSSIAGAKTLYVDNVSNCTGLTACYATIQEALNNAQADDDIRVFPGIYIEAVDLSLMGSALGAASDGNISFVTVDANNNVLARTVQVTPISGPAFTHSGSFFNGDIVFDGFDVISPDDDGIDLDLVAGDITIRNMTASGNNNDGIDLEVASGGHTMSVFDTIADNNNSHGLNLDGPDDTKTYIQNVQTHNNIKEGISIISESVGDIHDVTILDTSVENNGDDSTPSAGIEAWFEGTLTVKFLTTKGNRGPGLAVIDATKTVITDSTFDNSVTFSGIYLQSAGTFSVDRSVFTDNDAGGLNVFETDVVGNELTSLTVNCSIFTNNDIGIYLSPFVPTTANFNFNQNNFSNQSIAAIHASVDNDNIDAINNWWGDTSGPMHINNPTGTGDNVSDSLDDQLSGALGTVIYTPFSTVPIDIEQYPDPQVVNRPAKGSVIECRIPEYSVAVDVTGLADGVTLSLLNNAETLDVTNNGLSLFATTIDDRSEYEVSITANPTSPNQMCLITSDNATGSLDGIDEIIEIQCTTTQYNVGVDVSGLADGVTLSLLNNAEVLDVMTNGLNNFATALDDDSEYAVSITANPNSPNQMCLITSDNATGSLDGIDEIIDIQCTTNQYSIGGTVNGLHSGNNLNIQNNGTDSLVISSNGVFEFPITIDDLGGYSVSIVTQPSGPIQTCVVNSKSGNVAGTDVISVSIVCAFGDDLIFRNDFETP